MVSERSGLPRYVSLAELVAFDEEGEPTGFLNEKERRFFFRDGLSRGVEAGYFVPTGALSVDDETVYLWYGKYLNNTSCDQSHVLKWDVESGDWSHVAFFAEQKFVQVAPLLIDRDEVGESDSRCPLPWSEPHERGVLLYGSGPAGANDVPFDEASPLGLCSLPSTGSYRESGLYLAFIRLEDLDRPDMLKRAYFYTGPEDGCWAEGDIDAAAPIIDDKHFGEISAQRVPGSPYAIMGHNRLRANYALIDLRNPTRIPTPVWANSYGYGGYFVAGSVRYVEVLVLPGDVVVGEAILFDRVISTWKGPGAGGGLMDEYGTYTFSSFLKVGPLDDGRDRATRRPLSSSLPRDAWN